MLRGENCGTCLLTPRLSEANCTSPETDLRAVPLESADQLCVLAMKKWYEGAQNKKLKVLDRAWTTLEYAYSLNPLDAVVKDDAFNEARETFDVLAHSEHPAVYHTKTQFEARAVMATMPFLETRLKNIDPKPQDFGEVLSDLGQIIIDLDALTTKKPNGSFGLEYPQGYSINSHMTEIMVAYLLVLKNREANIASPREERSSKGDCNHDICDMTGGKKIPVQVKTDHRKIFNKKQHKRTIKPKIYDERVKVIILKDLEEWTCKETKTAPQRNLILRVIKDRHAGTGSERSGYILSTAADRVVSIVEGTDGTT